MKNKYGNIKKLYNGDTYDSKLEAKVAQDLDFRIKAGELIKVDRQVKIELTAHNIKICNYFIDFVATNITGVKEYIEVKGCWTATAKLKWKLFKAQYKKDIDLGIIEVEIIKLKP